MEINETKIFKHLEKTNTFYCENIKRVSSTAKEFLARIPAMFSNYTNHDIGHSARVADYMVDLLPEPIENYNDTELVIILFSAILHDVGMAVPETESDLVPSNQNEIRQKHHIRSETYINESMSDSDFRIDNESSINFKNIVSLIARSHGENISWIEKNLKEKEFLGNDTINPRFISCLLRLGDYLDFDSRRTPDCLFKFLKLSFISSSEWEKHFPITNYSKIDDNTIFFAGKCENPEIFRTISEYFISIETEIYNAKKLLRNTDDKYKLLIKDKIDNKITHNTFDSIDLQYSMDYLSISKLLMGEHLYNDKKCALREILQNSLDAVLLMNEISKNISSAYTPIIEIIITENEIKIKDNGIGMTSSEIENYFLKLGNSYYQSNDFKNLDVKYKPISHYGIGFVSSFLLSDSIKVRTSSFKKPNTLNILEIKKNNRFVIQKLENNDYPISGTEIIFEKNSFIKVFPSSNEICNYIKNTFKDTGVKFLLIENGQKTQIELQKHDKKNSINLSKYLNNIECFCTDPFSVLKSNSTFPQIYSIYNSLKSPGEYIFDLEYFNKKLIDKSELKIWADDHKSNYDINRIIQSNENLRYLEIYPIDDDTYDTYSDIYDIIGTDESTFDYMNNRSDFDDPIRIYLNNDLIFNDFHDYQILFSFKKFDSDTEEFIETVKSFCNTLYGQKYTIFLIRKFLEPIFISNDSYCNYKKNYTLPRNNNLFVKNVKITNYNIEIPVILKDLDIWNPEINILANDCFPDVTREKLDKITSRKLAFAIGRAYHLYILENAKITPTDKIFLEKFIETFYGNISDNDFCR